MKILNLASIIILFTLFACGDSQEGGSVTDETNTAENAISDSVMKGKTDPMLKPKKAEIYQLSFKSFEEPNMFTIEYPDNFEGPDEKIYETSDEAAGAISYWFKATEDPISFFIYPLYSTKDNNFDGITVNKETEKVTNESKENNEAGKEVLTVEIEALDGSYKRMYLKDDYCIAGMVYDTDENKELYSAAFKTFRNSVKNLTDN